MRVRVSLGVGLGITIALLLFPATAEAKGADGVTISGGGIPSPISVEAGGGSGEDLSSLAEQTGFFPAVFAQTPDPMLSTPPTADLGPKLVMTWHVPSGETTADIVRQDVYPYAAGGPVTYTAPGQPVFGEGARGGWFRASKELLVTLTRVGVPDRAALGSSGTVPPAPQPPAPTVASASSAGVPWVAAGAVGLVVLVGLITITRRAVGRRGARRARLSQSLVGGGPST